MLSATLGSGPASLHAVSFPCSAPTPCRAADPDLGALAALVAALVVAAVVSPADTAPPGDDERFCPTVKAVRHLHLHDVSRSRAADTPEPRGAERGVCPGNGMAC